MDDSLFYVTAVIIPVVFVVVGAMVLGVGLTFGALIRYLSKSRHP